MKKLLSLLSLVLVLSMLLCLASCSVIDRITGNDKTEDTGDTEAPSADGSTEEGSGAVNKTGVWKGATYLENTELGEGAKTVEVEVKAERQSVTFTVKTDAATLGEALLANGIIAGEEGPYGLYIKVVNGITADYDTDGHYWAFYQNGEYMMTGVDTTEISGGEHYELVYEKG